MGILADLKAIGGVLSDLEAIESGPVTINVSGPIRIIVVAHNGKLILDTTIEINTNVPAKP